MVVLTTDDIEKLRKASEEVFPKSLAAFSKLQNYLIKNPLIRLNPYQFDQLKKGLECLKDRYSEQELGRLAKSVLDRIVESENQHEMTELEKEVFDQLEQLQKD